MAEDWRLTVRLADAGRADTLVEALHSHEVEGDVGSRIAVSKGEGEVFLYADNEPDAGEARREVESVLQALRIEGAFQLDRWHPEAEEWVDAAVPLPSTPAAVQAEHDRLEEQEAAESEGEDIAEWEVRIELASHGDASSLADRLEQQGFEPTRRWKYLLIGLDDEDDANALAERLQGEVPAGATVHVEPGSGMAWRLMPKNRFAFFGGLSG